MSVHACYMIGTRILTARGEIAVEHLKSGDEVVVYRNGQQSLEAVTWIGYSAVDLKTHAHEEDAAPIRFRKDSIGENHPSRDLVVSPEHCLLLDGLCVPAKLLVNGATITSERNHAPFTYYHIELERHGMLLAENTLAESYLDTGNRSLFNNSDEPRQLHPQFTVAFTADRWLTDACAPLVRMADQLEPIWRGLADRSEQMGFAIPAVQTVADSDLHVLADGNRIDPVSDRDSRYVFVVPAGVTSVFLASRVCIPADKMVPGLRDRRHLGVSVNWIAIRSDNNEVILSADHPALQDGWNDVEWSNATAWRWTKGAAMIPWANVTGPAVMTVRCIPVDQYPVSNEQVARVA